VRPRSSTAALLMLGFFTFTAVCSFWSTPFLSRSLCLLYPFRMRIFPPQTRLWSHRAVHGAYNRTRHNVGVRHIVHLIQYHLLWLFLLLIGLSNKDIGCDGYCLECQVYPPDSLSAYHPTFNANISVNLADYGGARNLDLSVFPRCFYAPLLIISIMQHLDILAALLRIERHRRVFYSNTLPGRKYGVRRHFPGSRLLQFLSRWTPVGQWCVLL
jgi:hypothetical protein